MFNTRMIVTNYGGTDRLQPFQEALRKPERGEVRIRVQAAGVALADVMRREGLYPSSPAVPFTPGYDAAGVIDETGDEVQPFSAGDRVAVLFDGTGGYATYVYAKADDVIALPDGVDMESAAAVLLNYVSAYQMLHRLAKVSEGERILIHGASGGVGTALLDLGRYAGLNMYGTASAAKHSILNQYGALPIDYRRDDFVRVLHDTAPDGMDAVFDPIGGPNYERSLHTLNRSGRFVGYGYTSVLEQGDSSSWVKDWTRMMTQQKSDAGQPIFLYSITSLRKEKPDWFREDAETILDWLAKGRIRPHISHRVPLLEAANAHKLLGQSHTTGKVILTIS